MGQTEFLLSPPGSKGPWLRVRIPGFCLGDWNSSQQKNRTAGWTLTTPSDVQSMGGWGTKRDLQRGRGWSS